MDTFKRPRRFNVKSLPYDLCKHLNSDGTGNLYTIVPMQDKCVEDTVLYLIAGYDKNLNFIGFLHDSQSVI